MLDQRRAPGALSLQPFELVVGAVRVGVDPVRVLVEALDVTGPIVGEAMHGHAAYAIGALGVLVRPGDVVAGARGQDLDVVPRGEPFRHEPAEILGTADDLGPVPLDDEGDLHADSDSIIRSRGAGGACRAEVGQSLPLTGDYRRSQLVIVHQEPKQLGGALQVLGREADASASQGLRNGRRAEGKNRHAGGHGLDERHAEPLVLAERDVGARRAVVGRQLDVGHLSGEEEASGRHVVLGDESQQGRVVARHRVRPADEDEAIVGVDVALVVLGEPDVVFQLLVGGDAPDEQYVGRAVVERALERGQGRGVRKPLGVDQYGHHAGPRESKGRQLAAVVLGIAERQIDAARQRLQLGPAACGDTEDARVVPREEMRRRDVVVLEHPPSPQRGQRLGQRRGHGEVQHRDVAAAGRRIGERADFIAEIGVYRQGEDVRFVALAPQQIADAARAVADRVSAVRRRQPLVDHQRRIPVMPSSPEIRRAATPGRRATREAPGIPTA